MGLIKLSKVKHLQPYHLEAHAKNIEEALETWHSHREMFTEVSKALTTTQNEMTLVNDAVSILGEDRMSRWPLRDELARSIYEHSLQASCELIRLAAMVNKVIEGYHPEEVANDSE